MHSFKQRRPLLLCLMLACLAVGCSAHSTFDIGTPSLVDPAGEAAAEISQLWWILLGLGTTVYIGVMIFMVMALFRGRRDISGSPEEHPQAMGTGQGIVLWGGVVMPSVVLLGVTGLTVWTMVGLSDLEGSPAEQANAVTIEMTGHQYWWEIVYPGEEFVTANEVHIPVGEPVRFVITSGDVIHSFWVPELHGKMDMIPGQINTIWIEANESGDYWGICTEFCGMAHAHMRFVLVAEPREAYETWVAGQQQTAPEPQDELAQAGYNLFFDKNCSYCHAIDGTPADGDLGPDLTHLASRTTLAAGTIDYNIGNLGGWLADPQHIKPGNIMPASNLSGPELQAMLAYLETLE